jgi:hypothetical protein
MRIFGRKPQELPPPIPCALHPDKECRVEEQRRALEDEREKRERTRIIEARAELVAQELQKGHR